MRGLSFKWVQSYLQIRTQQVEINNILSIKIQYGVSLGSFLGPILFLVYVNDLSSTIDSHSLVRYADDTTFSFSETYTEDLE